jgi:site-specific recombinase XerC
VARFMNRRAYADLRPETRYAFGRIMRADVLPVLGNRSVTSIKKADIRSLHEAMTEKGHRVMANRILQAVRRLFRWLVEIDVLVTDPTDGVRLNKERPRERVLDADELQRIWHAASKLGAARADRPASG